MRFMAVVLAAVVLCACESIKPISTNKTNNETLTVEILGDFDGCRIYRFQDLSRDRYFVRCVGASSAVTGMTESCGKNCTNDVEIQTIEGH